MSKYVIVFTNRWALDNPDNFPGYKQCIHHQASDTWWKYVPVQAVFFFDLGQLRPFLQEYWGRPLKGDPYVFYESYNFMSPNHC